MRRYFFNTLILDRSEKCIGAAALRDDYIAIEFDQRHKGKCTLGETRMRHDEIGFVDAGITVQEDVDIERTRRVSIWPLTPEMAFYAVGAVR
jgi:hypothetical protein